MRELSIDIETYCEVDIKTAGAYKYAEKSEIILFGYSFDYEPPKCIDLLSGEELPDEVWEALTDPNVIKRAHNAPFEIACISEYFDIFLPIEQWRCTAVLSVSAGLPMSLDEASKALGTIEKKDSIGKSLIRYFCIPCKPSKVNDGRTRNLPEHAPDKWSQFIEYCKQDVVTEQAICKELSWVSIPETEQELWFLDHKINSNGVKIDRVLASKAILMDDAFRGVLIEEAKKLTGLSNPNSPLQLKEWLENKENIEVESLTKDSVQELLKTVKSPEARRLLEIRALLAKSSIKKYQAMLNAAGRGDRVRGMFQFGGAGRTMRWSGRLCQPQNYPRIALNDVFLESVRNLAKTEEPDLIELCYGDLPNMLSQLTRTAFVAEQGSRFIVADHSAIEARVVSWLAGEQWVIDVFKTHGKIYEATASQMFGVPIDEITKTNPLRQKGKISQLALSYAGGVGALITMGALAMGLEETELPGIVKAWREANPMTVKFWYDLENAAKLAITSGETIKVGDKGISFTMKKGNLLLSLPSRRNLVYANASIETVVKRMVFKEIVTLPDGSQVLEDKAKLVEREQICFYGVDQTTKQWVKQNTYSGKLCENVTQAVARDCLAVSMTNLDKVGYKIVMTIHDECVLEMPFKQGSVEEVNRLMVIPRDWMRGLPLKSEGGENIYYSK